MGSYNLGDQWFRGSASLNLEPNAGLSLIDKDLQDHIHECFVNGSDFRYLWKSFFWHWLLTHWGRDNMAAIFQMTCSNWITWMKMHEFLSRFHWSVPKGPISNIPALVQIMARHRPGDKPMSEPMMVSLLTHICITRPQWVKLRYQDLFTISFNVQPWTAFHEKLEFHL